LLLNGRAATFDQFAVPFDQFENPFDEYSSIGNKNLSFKKDSWSGREKLNQRFYEFVESIFPADVTCERIKIKYQSFVSASF
jgi:hypothetical protein